MAAQQRSARQTDTTALLSTFQIKTEKQSPDSKSLLGNEKLSPRVLVEDIKKSPPKSPRIKDHSPKVKIKMEYSPPKESSPKTAKASPAKSKSQTVKKDGKLVDVKKEKNVKATQMKASPKGKVSAKVSPNLKGPKSPKGTKTLKDKKLKNGTAPAAKKTLKTTKKNKNSARAKNKMIVKLPSCSPRKKAAVIEKVPVKVKTPVKDKTPVKEKTPVKSPVKEKSPVKNNTPLKDTTLVKEKIPVKDTTPVKEKLPVKDKNPVKDTTPVKDKTAVKDKIAVKDKTTMKDKTLVKGPLKDKPSIKDKTSAKESGSASNKKSSVNVKIKPGVKRKILSDDSDKGNNSHVPAKKTKQTGDKKILPRKKCVKGKRKKKKNTPEEYKSLHNIGSRSATEKVVSYCESTIELKASFEQRMELEHSLEASLKRKMALKNARSPTLLSGKKSEVKDVKNRDDDKEKDSDSKKCQRLKGTAAKECDKKPCKKEPVKMKNGEDPNEDKEKVGSKRKLGKESVGRPKKKKGKIVKNTKKNVQSVFNSFCMLRKKSGEPLSKRYQHLQPRPFRFRREASLNATCMMNMMYEKEEHHLAKVVKVEELTEVKDKVTEEKQNDTSSKGPEKKTNSDKKQSPKKVSPAKSAKGKEKKPVPKVKGKVNSEKVDKKNDKNVKFPKTKLGLKKKKKVGGGEGKEIEIVSGKVKKAAKLAATANWMLPRRVASLNAEAILAASREPRKKSISRKRAARTDADVFPAHAVKEKEKGEEYMGKIVAHWVEGWGTDFLKLKPTQHWVTADMVEHVNVTDVPEPLRVPFVPKEEMVSPPPPSAGTSPVRSPLPHMTQRAAPNLTMPSPMMVNNILPSGPLQGPGPQGQMYAHHQAFLRPPTGGRHMAAERQRGQEQFSQIPSHGQYRPQHNQGQPMGGPGQGMRFPPHGGPPYMNAHGMVGRFQPPNQIQGQHGQMTNQMSHPHHMTGQYRPMTNQMPRQQHQMTNRMAGPQRQMTNQMPLNRQMPGQMQRMPMGKQLQRQQQQQGQMMTQGPGQCHMPNQMPGQQQGNTQMIAQQGQMTNQMPGPPGQFTALLLGTQGHMSGQEMMNTQIQGSMANQMHGQQNPMANQMASPQGHMTGQMIENQVQSPRPDGQMNSNVPLHSGQITSQMHSPNMQMTNQMHGQMTNQMQAHGQMANQMAPQHGQMTNQMQGQHGQMPNQMQDQQEQMANQVSSQHGQLSNQMQGQQDQMVNQMSPQHSHMTNQMTGSDGQVANQMPEQHGGPMGNQMPPQQQQQQQVPEQQNKISEPLEQGPNPNYEQKQSHCHPGHMQGHGPPAHSQHSTIPGACTYPYPHSSTPMGGTPPTSQCQNYSMGGLSSLDNLSVMYHRPFGSAFTVPAGYPNPQVSYSYYQPAGPMIQAISDPPCLMPHPCPIQVAQPQVKVLVHNPLPPKPDIQKLEQNDRPQTAPLPGTRGKMPSQRAGSSEKNDRRRTNSGKQKPEKSEKRSKDNKNERKSLEKEKPMEKSVPKKPGSKRNQQSAWKWDGESEMKPVFSGIDIPPLQQKCYAAIRHNDGDIIKVGDCVLVCSGPRKKDIPFVAKIHALWESSEDADMTMSVLWYYRPEHAETERLPKHISCEIFASKHHDENSIACIEDKCYVLTFSEYCRYKAHQKAAEEKRVHAASSIPGPEEPYPRKNRLPPLDADPDCVFLCRRVYDFKQKRVLKNPS